MALILPWFTLIVCSSGLFQYRTQPERARSFDVVLLFLCLTVILDARAGLPCALEDTLRWRRWPCLVAPAPGHGDPHVPPWRA